MKLESLSPIKNPLEQFSPKEKDTILSRLAVLTPLCHMVSGDIQMKVEVNGDAGWHWDFEHNVVRCDPKDLLEKPIDYLRFVMQHEAGHRKVTRVKGVIPDEVWDQPGFSFMINAIEDPRMNNYVADTIPKFRDEMIFSYGLDKDFEVEMRAKAKDKTGQIPRFMQAGFEYINLWLQEVKGTPKQIDPSLPEDVKAVIEKTLEAARSSWLTYPTRKEVDKGAMVSGKTLTGEETITEYARASYQVNLNDVWPLFKTLIDQDIEDLKDQLKKKGKGGDKGEKSKDKADTGKPEDSESGEENEQGGSDEQMTESEARELATQIIKEIEKALNEHFESKDESKDVPQGKSEKPKEADQPTKTSDRVDNTEDAKVEKDKIQQALDEIRKKFEAETPKGLYRKTLAEVSPIITRLEDELREIFVQRKRNAFFSGFRSGVQVDIKREIASEMTGVPDANTFMKRELPLEHDYAIEVLVDLSGSMRGQKIDETYKAVVALCEALKNIGINLSVTGFNDRLYQYKNFDQNYTDDLRENTERMHAEVSGSGARYNDDGWAVKEVADRIKKRKEKRKIVFVLSDGLPEESPQHQNFELKQIVANIEAEKEIHIIGLGIGPGTGHVSRFYSDNLADVSLAEFAHKLAIKVREAVEN